MIKRGEALDHLANLEDHSVGAVVSDPPFFCGFGRGHGGFGDDPWEAMGFNLDAVTDWATLYTMEFRRVLRKGGATVLMAGIHASAAWMNAAERAGLIWMAELEVIWNTGKPRQKNFGSLHTHILWFAAPGARHTWNSEKNSIYSNIVVCRKVPIQDRLHPAQKPIELTTFLISLLTRESDLIVDPFCGSGSTLVSAKLLGRPFLGIDRNQNSCDISRRRVRNAEFEEEGPIYLWVNGRLEAI
jgi:DNA modification methylase